MNRLFTISRSQPRNVLHAKAKAPMYVPIRHLGKHRKKRRTAKKRKVREVQRLTVERQMAKVTKHILKVEISEQLKFFW